MEVSEQLDSVSEESFNNVEADVYWCLSKFLDSILDNYSHGWPGITKSYTEVQEVISRVDSDLFKHFEN